MEEGKRGRGGRGKKPTKYFCALESRNYVNKIIPKLVTEDGTFIAKQEDSLEEVNTFYSDLYKHREGRDININNILNKNFPFKQKMQKIVIIRRRNKRARAILCT